LIDNFVEGKKLVCGVLVDVVERAAAVVVDVLVIDDLVERESVELDECSDLILTRSNRRLA